MGGVMQDGGRFCLVVTGGGIGTSPVWQAVEICGWRPRHIAASHLLRDLPLQVLETVFDGTLVGMPSILLPALAGVAFVSEPLSTNPTDKGWKPKDKAEAPIA